MLTGSHSATSGRDARGAGGHHQGIHRAFGRQQLLYGSDAVEGVTNVIRGEASRPIEISVGASASSRTAAPAGATERPSPSSSGRPRLRHGSTRGGYLEDQPDSDDDDTVLTRRSRKVAVGTTTITRRTAEPARARHCRPTPVGAHYQLALVDYYAAGTSGHPRFIWAELEP